MTTKIQLFCTTLVVLIVHSKCSVVYNFDHVKKEQQAAHEFKVTDQVVGCSTRLSRLISELCSNELKLVKLDNSPIGEIIHHKRTTNENWLRKRRQVATECCEKACSVSDLIAYCPPDSALLKSHPDLIA